jgi:hypothetical protein
VMSGDENVHIREKMGHKAKRDKKEHTSLLGDEPAENPTQVDSQTQVSIYPFPSFLSNIQSQVVKKIHREIFQYALGPVVSPNTPLSPEASRFLSSLDSTKTFLNPETVDQQ